MSTALEVPAFDLAGPLPGGVTVLEASAGTGKTYAIATLAARFLADGTPLERLLMVTFTRMATGELRERVRERLLATEYGLARALAGGGTGDDPVVAALAQGEEPEVTARHRRLARGLADFDAATISTTHGFCQEILGGLGLASNPETEVELVEDLGDLVEEVLDDLYVRRFHRAGEPILSRAEALRIAHAVTGNPSAPLAAAAGERAQMRRRLAAAVREELELRKRRQSVMTYDDLLIRLDAALRGPGGATIAARLRARYAVVLIDEFQDTDPVQWSIMRRAFAAEGSTLVLIADPKQAIYAFRGADVYAYLEAAAAAETRATLGINWRSDDRLLRAFDGLFGGARLGHEGIAYRRVAAAPANRRSRLRDAPRDVPLRIRILERARVAQTVTGFARAREAREHIARDLAGDIVSLLHSKAEIDMRSGSGGTVAREHVCPGHLAVLVRTNAQASAVREALEAARVPAVTGGAGSVFATPSARAWLTLLEALERPSAAARARSAALTPFLGWSAEQIATADELAWEEVHGHLHDWARVLREDGVASLQQALSASEHLPRRILAAAHGERQLTDLRHIGQLLHAVATEERLGTTALASWLRGRIREPEREPGDEERSRRLESDAQAVQVLTVHRSKGLEFPIVYVPFLWEPTSPREHEPATFHDPQAGNARVIDVALEGRSFREHREQSLRETRGEDLRLAYVALTRARHQVVLWWAGSWNSCHGPLTRLVFRREDDGTISPYGGALPDDATVLARFEELSAQAPGCISVEHSLPGLPVSFSPPAPSPGELTAAEFTRTLDWRWRRTSYSDITAATHEVQAARTTDGGLVASEPEHPVVEDEPAVSEPPASPATETPDPRLAAVRSPLDGLPSGPAIGTLVHQVLEATDFDAPDLHAELAAHLDAALAWRPVEIGERSVLETGLRSAIETPLGGSLGSRRLRDFARQDRLDELSFELPLAGGDRPTGEVTITEIARILGELLPAGDPLSGYPQRLGDPALRPSLRGYLTGSLDLVLRVAAGDGTRYAVIDYKTNRLAPGGEPLTAWHYRPQALAAEMAHRHYGLQALLYLVALHRYLRWRDPGYEPDRDLVGVRYLFVRGMSGPSTPGVDGGRCGVFGWTPPGGLVAALSDALDGR